MESNSVALDIFTSLECVFFSVLLFWLYYKKTISSIELILYALACSSFFVPFISDTITPMFFVTTFFFITEAIILHRSKRRLKLSLLIVLILPFLSSIVVAGLIFFGFDIFDGNNPSVFRIIYDGLFFYVKYFLPFVFLGVRVFRETRVRDINYFFDVMKKVALISCSVGLFQLLLSFVIKDALILRIIGLRPNYVSFTASGQEAATARISAFFVEPKAFASFLVVVFPLFLRDKKILSISLILIVGLLTASQTFVVGIVVIFIEFFLLRRFQNIRSNIFFSILIIMSAFYSVSILKSFFFDFYLKHSDNYVVNLVLARAIERYDVDDDNTITTSFMGMPLEKDTELPMSLFFSNKPLLYLSGYGLKNGGFISPKYYIFNDVGFKKVGSMSYSADLRWYYFSCEFGVIIFFIWLWYFTRPFDPCVITFFENKYYSFLLVFLFFNGIELTIIMIYSLYAGTVFNKKSGTTKLIICG
jgi:hypothetical protein